jgi:hypothetical protein
LCTSEFGGRGVAGKLRFSRTLPGSSIHKTGNQLPRTCADGGRRLRDQNLATYEIFSFFKLLTVHSNNKGDKGQVFQQVNLK